jgi:hypothetical protein
MGKNLVRTRQALGFRRGALGVDLVGVENLDMEFFIPAQRWVGLVAFVFRLIGDILVFRQVEQNDSLRRRLRRRKGLGRDRLG